MTRTMLIGGLMAALLAGQAAAADRQCRGEARDWPGLMMVTITVDGGGKPREAFARLQMGGEKVEFPIVSAQYEMAADKPSLGDLTYLSVGALVSKDQNPKSKTAVIAVSVDDRQAWSRPWGMYAQQDWSAKDKDGNEAVGFFGLIPLEARESGIGKAMETGQFIAVAVRGVEAKETFAHRQFALARRDVLQPMADKARAAALAKAADYKKACELDRG